MHGGSISGNALDSVMPPGSSSNGGIVQIHANDGADSAVLFEDVAFERNRAQQTDRPDFPITHGSLIGVWSSGVPLMVTVERLRMRNNSVHHPSADIFGGLLYFEATGGGALTATVRDSELTSNTVDAAELSGGLLFASAETGGAARVLFERSLIAENSVAGGEGDFTRGLVETDGASVVFQNSTIHGNTIRGGRYHAGSFAGDLTFINATVTDNLTSDARNMTQPIVGTIHAYHSVFSGNTGDPHHKCLEYPYVWAASVQGHHNWFNDPQGCARGEDEHSTYGRDPVLLPLADNGGSTRSRAPDAASPLIDAGDATCSTDGAAAMLTTDQRASTRPLGMCDLGSVELR
jgi:hypothetical protein